MSVFDDGSVVRNSRLTGKIDPNEIGFDEWMLLFHAFEERYSEWMRELVFELDKHIFNCYLELDEALVLEVLNEKKV